MMPSSRETLRGVASHSALTCPRVFAALVAVLVVYCPAVPANDAGRYFTADRSRNALGHVAGSLSAGDLDRVALGRSLFAKPWVEAPASTTARDGLGPLFNANSCIACHRNHGGGNALGETGAVHRSIVMQVNGDPVYGSQIATHGVHGVPPEAEVRVCLTPLAERYADGSGLLLQRPLFRLENSRYGPLADNSFLHPRRAPALVGLGLVERIPESRIEEFADPGDLDGDGISGTARLVWSLPDSAWRLGRFGWKAARAGLLEQVAAALSDDMGLTSPWFADEGCSEAQSRCRAAGSGGNPEAPAARVEAIAFYLAQLQAPRGVAEHPGLRRFDELGCGACHRRGYRSADNLEVNPYSDFLLHDMGTGLADPGDSGQPGAGEWRTAPLWGIGLAKVLNPRAGYLHDGRAATLEQAILWHAGEARAARAEFSALSAAARAQLISFLESL